jgi:cysteine synthase
MARRLAREEGILAGPSSGANVFAALKVAKDLGKRKVMVNFYPTADKIFKHRTFQINLYEC